MSSKSSCMPMLAFGLPAAAALLLFDPDNYSARRRLSSSSIIYAIKAAFISSNSSFLQEAAGAGFDGTLIEDGGYLAGTLLTGFGCPDEAFGGNFRDDYTAFEPRSPAGALTGFELFIALLELVTPPTLLEGFLLFTIICLLTPEDDPVL